MSALVPFSGCDRHVKADETTCPFCESAHAPEQNCVGGNFGLPAARLSRAALVAAGAALSGADCQIQSLAPPYGRPPDIDAGAPTDGTPDAAGTTR